MLTKEELIELANELDMVDPIDWGMLPIHEYDVYDEMADRVVELASRHDQPNLTYILQAALVKLLAENFVLHAQRLNGL